MNRRKKTQLIQLSLLGLALILYVGNAFFGGEPKTNKEKPIISNQINHEQSEEKKVNNEDSVLVLKDEPIQRYDGEKERSETEAPRIKYDLPLPETERTIAVKSMSVKRTEKCEYSYFDNSLFIGDSVTVGLQNYITKKRKENSTFLGKSNFLSIGSYGVAEAVSPPDENSIHKIIGGKKTPPEEIVKVIEADKVFICLGLNDIGLYSQDEYIENYFTLLTRIRTVSPTIKVIIQSVTPLTLYGERKVLYNAKIDKYNESLATFALENNCYFADVADLFKDKSGYLATQLSSDDYCHLEAEAYEMWINYLMTHTV